MFSKNLIRFYLVVLIVFSAFSIASAQENPEVKWKDGKKYIVHKIQKGETWSGIAVKFKSSMKDLQAINPKAKELKFDQAILIPYDNYLKSKKVSSDNKTEIVEAEKNSHAVSNTASTDSLKSLDKSSISDNKAKQKKDELVTDKSTTKKKNDLKQDKKFVLYKVQSGETLYRIAKKYNMNYNDLAKFNDLKSTNVKAGQTIKIPLSKSVVNSDAIEPVKSDSVVENNNSVTTEEEPHNSNSYQEFNGTITEQGVATWLMESSSEKKEKFYALHRSAPIGTIIKVKNPMSNRSVFVKVVGVLPDTGDNHDVLIKITQSAARRIGIVDSRFRVEITYKAKTK